MLDKIVFQPELWFAGYALGFFLGYLVSLVKYIIGHAFAWMLGRKGE